MSESFSNSFCLAPAAEGESDVSESFEQRLPQQGLLQQLLWPETEHSSSVVIFEAWPSSLLAGIGRPAWGMPIPRRLLKVGRVLAYPKQVLQYVVVLALLFQVFRT